MYNTNIIYTIIHVLTTYTFTTYISIYSTHMCTYIMYYMYIHYTCTCIMYMYTIW